MEKGISICVRLAGKYVLYTLAFWITYEWLLAEALNLVERPNVHFYLLLPALIVAGETLTHYMFDRYGLQWIKSIWINKIVEGTDRDRKRGLALLFFGGLIFSSSPPQLPISPFDCSFPDKIFWRFSSMASF